MIKLNELTDEIDVSAIVVIEVRGDEIELAEDFVVTGHVGGQDAADDALAHALVLVAGEGGEQVGRRVLQDVERHRAVVVLQRRDVVVPQGQLRTSVDLNDFF